MNSRATGLGWLPAKDKREGLIWCIGRGAVRGTGGVGEDVAVNSSARARDPEPGSPGVLGSAPDHRYLLDNAQAEAGERFVALAELFDGVTRGTSTVWGWGRDGAAGR